MEKADITYSTLISSRLKEILNKRNLKQADLVKMTGLGKSAISQYISGKVTPKKDKISILAKALNVDELWLMGIDNFSDSNITEIQKKIFSNNLKFFMEQKNKSRKEICDDLDIKYTTFVDWEKGNTYPRIDKIELLAKYFGIQKSDLIEEKSTISNNEPELTARDERDIKKHLDKALENLENDEALMFDGEPVEMDKETKELLKASLENSIRLAKTLAKKKYTPKKYRKENDND
ncbi:helix-turn-helix domain-containing protein [Megamonas funiformis]|uniref:helix-turn-helix domain-containing protein n=1 Tax=Megamonas funiformis TaxID=437897 RepID=UPI001CD43F47|nr:helix-turn-helix transcriptional regulator [Megamonas funiformis]UBS49254.1 helix-turn-helix domain-containing protein [Megamonas funiformis]GLU98743.1 hypothetical protein Mfun01_13880 [Megamonas funiformis]